MNERVTAPSNNQRTIFSQGARKEHMVPVWEVMHEIIREEPADKTKANVDFESFAPRTLAVPHVWNFDQIHQTMIGAGKIISAAEALRRLMLLENPGLPGSSQITGSLSAGIQMVLPGEVVKEHRHRQTAARIGLHGGGAFTQVDGGVGLLYPGDFIITLPWAWHYHGNGSNQPTIWLDAIDLPLVNLFDANFADVKDAMPPAPKNYDESSPPVTRPGLIRLGHDVDRQTTAQFRYPYDRTREALATMLRSEAIDPWLGHIIEYVNPSDSLSVATTMSFTMRLLPKGFRTRSYRSTDSTVFVPIEGSGKLIIDGKEMPWKAKDVFVVPAWKPYEIEVSAESVLFAVSDRAAQKRLNLWRELKSGDAAVNAAALVGG